MTNPKIQFEWCHACCKLTPHTYDKKHNRRCLHCKPLEEKPKAEKRRSMTFFPNTKINAEKAAEILEKRLAGVQVEELAKEYGVSKQTIQDHIRGFTATKTMIMKWIDERIEFHLKGKKA